MQAPNLTLLKDTYRSSQFKMIREGKRKSIGANTIMTVLNSLVLSEKEMEAALQYLRYLPPAESKNIGLGDKVKRQASV